MDYCPFVWITLLILILLIVRYPDYGRDILHCLTRYSTLRACDIDFHDKARATLTSVAMRIHIRLGRIVYKGFEVISVVSVVLFVIFLWNLTFGILDCIIAFMNGLNPM